MNEWVRKPWQPWITWMYSLSGQAAGIVLAFFFASSWWWLPIGQVGGCAIGLGLSEVLFQRHMRRENIRFATWLAAKYPVIR